LFVLLSFLSLALAALPSNYESLTADQKLATLWRNVDADHNQSGKWPSTFEMLALMLRSDWVTGHTYADEMPGGRQKLIHAVGAIAEARFVIEPNDYTGFFVPLRQETVLLRLSLATAADSKPLTPGLSLKALRDGIPSANLVAMWELDGQTGFNFFAHPFATRVPERTDLPLKLQLLGRKFKLQTRFPGSVGLSEFAKFDTRGFPVSFPQFPWALIFQPNPLLARRMASNTNNDMARALSTGGYVNGTEVVYKVWAVTEPRVTPLQYLGYLQLKTPFRASKYADETLFIKHTFIEEDFAYRPDWEIYYGDANAKRWETEGAAYYQNSLPPWTDP